MPTNPTDEPATIEQVIEQGLLHDLSMIGLEYASKGLEQQAATITAAIEALSRNTEPMVTDDMLNAGCAAAGWHPSHGYGGNRDLAERIFLAMLSAGKKGT